MPSLPATNRGKAELRQAISSTSRANPVGKHGIEYRLLVGVYAPALAPLRQMHGGKVMQEFPINWLAILAAVIIKQALGALWFSPALFGLPWCKLTGVSEAEIKAGLAKAPIPDVIGSALMAFVLVHAVHYAGAHNWAQGAAVGFFNWLGFVAVATLGSVTFERRPLQLYLINNGFLLLALVLMGVVLAVWA
jgi:hypothetical protein